MYRRLALRGGESTAPSRFATPLAPSSLESGDRFIFQARFAKINLMNLAPKVGPLVAELLSGVSFLLIAYLAVHGVSFAGIDELSSGAIVVLVVLAWIIGTFFDLVRNLLEWVWDSPSFTEHPLNWRFFFSGKQSELENLEHYFWSFYILDADMAIAILLSVILSPFIAYAKGGKTPCYLWVIWLLLVGIACLFIIDARLLRTEIKGLVDAEPR